MVSTNGEAVLGTSTGITTIGEFVANDGTAILFSAGNNSIFTGVTTLVDATPAGYTITANDWKFVSFNNRMYMFQRDHEPLIYDANTTALTAMSAHAASIGTPPQANECIAAFGRLWAADVTDDKSTIYWSDLLNGNNWSTGTSGSIDLSRVWPTGYDIIVGLAAHNGFLIIFGRNTILVYDGAEDPSTMAINDTTTNIGCVSRDAIVSTGVDLVFLDDSGVRSLSRTVQEKSAPLGDISKNVNSDIKALYAAEFGSIKMHYSPKEAFILLSFDLLNVVYCFNTRSPLPDGSFRATTWSGIDPLTFTTLASDKLYLGTATGIAEHIGYNDNTASYQLSYFSHPLSFGSTSNLKFLKKINLTTFNGAEAVVVLSWAYNYAGAFTKYPYTLPTTDVGQYNLSEFNTAAEFASHISLINRQQVNANGQGTVVAIGIETVVDGNAIAIQELNIHALQGRVV